MTDIREVLNVRKTTHGPYEKTAADSQDMKTLIRRGLSFDKLTPQQIEALDMIVHKIARIINGNPLEIDHWMDIGGYNQLAIDCMLARRRPSCKTDESK
jgi:hypothetical protein